MYAVNGATGLKGTGKTAIRVSDLDGFADSPGETFTLNSIDGSSVLATGTISLRKMQMENFSDGNISGILERTLRTKKDYRF